MTMESTKAVEAAADVSAPRATPAEPQRTGPVPGTPPGRRRRLRQRNTQVTALVATDALAAATAAAAAATVCDRGALVLHLVPALFIVLALHQQGGLYRVRPSGSSLGEAPRLLWRVALGWSATAAVVAATRPDLTTGWPTLLFLIALHVTTATLLRGCVHQGQRIHQRRNPRSTLVVGTEDGSAAAWRVAAVLHAHPEYGMRPVGLVVPAADLQAPPFGEGASAGAAGPVADVGRRSEPGSVPLLSSPEDVTRAVIQNAVTDAVFSRPLHSDGWATALIRHLRALGCTLWLVDGDPASGGRTWQTSDAGHVWGFPCLHLDPPPARAVARAVKRGFDVVAAALALVVTAPVLAGCALAVRLADGRGVLFRQERIGAHGRPFVMLKFRTLRPHDEGESATRWNVAGDRRMSRVGRALRRTSLDELPQLWNVLRGDMSLVGPRPERPYFVRQFSEQHPGYADRDRAPVGITGLAQVHGLRGDTSIEDRARFDNHYIDTWSLWHDVQILLRTAGSVFRLGGS